MDKEPGEEQHKDNKKVEELRKALDLEKKRSEELLSRLKYAHADLENFKKRCGRQIEEAKKYGNESLIMELLGIVDELELAVQSARSSDSKGDVTQGVEMTLKKLKKILENEGISPIECVGKPFDPSKHEAVARIEKEDAEECTVIEEIRKGYTMREKVIRPSTVKVVVKTSKSPEEANLDE